MSINNVIGNCKKLECTFDHMVTNSQYFAAPVNSFQFISMYMPTKFDHRRYNMLYHVDRFQTTLGCSHIYRPQNMTAAKVLFSEAGQTSSGGH